LLHRVEGVEVLKARTQNVIWVTINLDYSAIRWLRAAYIGDNPNDLHRRLTL